MAANSFPVSVDDLYPKIPETTGADHYPATGDCEVVFVVCSPVSGQLFTRTYSSQQLIRSDISARLPDLRAQVFFAEARKLLVYVEEVERHLCSDAAFGGPRQAISQQPGEDESRAQEPGRRPLCRYHGYRPAIARAEMQTAHRGWDEVVDEHTSEVETLCRETPMLADCPGFWPLWPASRILVARDVVQVFEDAKVRGNTHVTFRLSFAPWGIPIEAESSAARSEKPKLSTERPDILPRSFSLPTIKLARMQAVPSSTTSSRPLMAPRCSSSPAGLGSSSERSTATSIVCQQDPSLSRSLTVSGSTASASPMLRRALAIRRPQGRHQVMNVPKVDSAANERTAL